MKKTFHGKFMTIAKVQPIAKTQIITVDVNVVDVNVTTRSKATKEQVFKDIKPRKVNSATNWEKEKQLKKSMVETIQHSNSRNKSPNRRAIHIYGGMEHNLVGYDKYYSYGSTKI